MPALDNPRHERFAQELAQGHSITEAYERAGYAPHRQCAHRLWVTNENVKARVEELQAASVVNTSMTLERIAAQLMEDREEAKKHKQPSAMVQADRALARLYGLDVERVEATHRQVTDEAMRPEDWARQYAQGEDKPAQPH